MLRSRSGGRRRTGMMADTCPRGHPWSENTYVPPDGWRKCRACNRENVAKHLAKKRAALRADGKSTRGRRLGMEWRIRLGMDL